MTKKQLINTCMRLRPSARDWRSGIERVVNYFDGYVGFDYENWEKGKYVEARAIVAHLLDRMIQYHMHGHSSPIVQKKLKKIKRLCDHI